MVYAMKRYLLLTGNEVEFNRAEEVKTLEGLKRKQTVAINQGLETALIDRTITTTDITDELNYAEINRYGEQIGWILHKVDELIIQ
jgi:hypothetical protein